VCAVCVITQYFVRVRTSTTLRVRVVATANQRLFIYIYIYIGVYTHYIMAEVIGKTTGKKQSAAVLFSWEMSLGPHTEGDYKFDEKKKINNLILAERGSIVRASLVSLSSKPTTNRIAFEQYYFTGNPRVAVPNYTTCISRPTWSSFRSKRSCSLRHNIVGYPWLWFFFQSSFEKTSSIIMIQSI